ncbi:MAG: sulfurtransferase [Candidatus Dormibacteria bacterium]
MPDTLVDAAWLSEHLKDPHLRVIDFRWELQGGSRRDLYLEGHVPGAVFVALEDVTGRNGPGRHPIPTATDFAEAMRRAGVGTDSQVVVYDANGGFSAARLWWLLQHFGHPAVAVLDGGLPAWTGPRRGGEEEVARGNFETRPVPGGVVDHLAVAARRPTEVLVDARAGERYRGETEPVDRRAGHIPGAVNVPWTQNLTTDGRFLDPSSLRLLYADAGVGEGSCQIVYCGSGVSACVNLLALRVAGLDPAVLYEGSWSDWSARPELPAATGERN